MLLVLGCCRCLHEVLLQKHSCSWQHPSVVAFKHHTSCGMKKTISFHAYATSAQRYFSCAELCKSSVRTEQVKQVMKLGFVNLEKKLSLKVGCWG
jgi:hypothetical protein